MWEKRWHLEILVRIDFAVGLWRKWRIWINKVKSRRLEGGRSKIKREEDGQCLWNRRKVSTNPCGFLVMFQSLQAASVLCSSVLTVPQFDFSKRMVAWLCGFTGLFRLFMERASWHHLVFGLIFPSPSLPHLIKTFLSLTCNVTTMVLRRSAVTNYKIPCYPGRLQAYGCTGSQHLCKGKNKRQTQAKRVYISPDCNVVASILVIPKFPV